MGRGTVHSRLDRVHSNGATHLQSSRTSVGSASFVYEAGVDEMTHQIHSRRSIPGAMVNMILTQEFLVGHGDDLLHTIFA